MLSTSKFHIFNLNPRLKYPVILFAKVDQIMKSLRWIKVAEWMLRMKSAHHILFQRAFVFYLRVSALAADLKPKIYCPFELNEITLSKQPSPCAAARLFNYIKMGILFLQQEEVRSGLQ